MIGSPALPPVRYPWLRGQPVSAFAVRRPSRLPLAAGAVAGAVALVAIWLAPSDSTPPPAPPIARAPARHEEPVQAQPVPAPALVYPILLEHRDLVYERHLTLPVEL